ncbi:hypothetical protein LZD49_06890 [Dyadobacter sp. CY261]|uniref:hypothetical protein n=1 Tax=Dyadobacter sp. CY261 TaxID=2907203 RepID=UPI001F41D838|nr:hypothetical protein [Dyadobacter sp. CY261]MCF0070191.1 hypothetical protein [Dyadobacter sp. CY261]
MKKLYTLLLMLAAALCGCIHSAPVPDEVKSSAPGFGTSRQHPTGKPLTLPAGIKIVGKPHWDLDCIAEANNEKRVYGSGGEVRFCIQFSNNTSQPIIVTIPPGTIFISESTESQNGLVIQMIQVTVPPLSTPFFYFLNNCLNPDRDVTNLLDEFEAQPIVTDHPGVTELTNMLSGKKVNSEDYNHEVPPTEIFVPVQRAVSEVSHTGSMAAETRASLSRLPDK